MTEIKRASGNKPTKTLTGYVSVRAPELKNVYSTIISATSTSEIKKKFGRPVSNDEENDDGVEDGRKISHVERTLKFLYAIDLIESPTEDIRDTVAPINEDLFPNLPFEVRLLYHCNQQEGKQAHFADIHRALMNECDRILQTDSKRSAQKTVLNRELDYNFGWGKQGNKIDMWVTLCEQLGLLSETDDGLVMSPCRALLHDALILAPTSSDKDAEYGEGSVENGEFLRTLSWINDNLFTVYEARTGTPRVHPAIADVLRNMEQDEVLSLSSRGDAQNEVEIPPPDLNDDVRGNRRSVTHISIQSRPSETEYQYPLNQLLTHQ